MECKFCGKKDAQWQAEESEFYYCDQECWVVWHLDQMFSMIEALIDQRLIDQREKESGVASGAGE